MHKSLGPFKIGWSPMRGQHLINWGTTFARVSKKPYKAWWLGIFKMMMLFTGAVVLLFYGYLSLVHLYGILQGGSGSWTLLSDLLISLVIVQLEIGVIYLLVKKE